MLNYSEWLAHIRELRQQRGLTQEQMARAIGVSRAHYTTIESGRRTVVTYLQMKAMKDALGITDVLLFFGVETPVPEEIVDEDDNSWCE